MNDRIASGTSAQIGGGAIQGIDFRLLTMNSDHRGHFTEVYSQDWSSCAPPSQWSVVQSRAGVFRGMHLHLRHDETISLIAGHAFVGLLDIREGSPSRGVWSLYELYGSHLDSIIFPRGVLHGWYLAKESCHLQGVSETWAHYGADDNLGCHWADPDLGIPWPMTEAVLSERAAGFPSLKALLGRLERHHDQQSDFRPVLSEQI